MSTNYHYFTLYSLLALCRYVHCCHLHSVQYLSLLNTVQSVGSVSLCPLLSSTVCPLSFITSHCTVCWLCVALSTAVFYSLSTIFHYFTLYSLLVLCRYVHCCYLQSVHYLSLLHNVPSVGSVSLCPLLSSTVCPLSYITSHCTVCWFSDTMSTAAFYSLSTVCQYLTLYSLLVMCHYVHCCLREYVHCLSVPHILQSVGSVTLCPLLPSTVCQYLTLYSRLVLWHYVHCCLLQNVHCLSVPHTVQSVGSVTLYPLLSSTVCPLSFITSHCTVCWFCVALSTAGFYSLSTIFHYLTLYSLLVLCRYVHCCLLQSVHCLSVPHTVQSVGSVSLCPLLSSTVCPLSFITSHCRDCWFCVAMSTAVF